MSQISRATAAPQNADGPARASRLTRAISQETSLIDRLLFIRSEVAGRIVFTSSFGVEDQVILNAIARAGTDIEVVTLDTGRLFPETLATIDESVRRFRVPIRVIAPAAEEAESLIARDGMLGFRTSVDARKACCDVRKVRPLARALAGAAAWITGLRRAQSDARAGVEFASYDRMHHVLKFNPLTDWDEAAVQQDVEAFNIPVNPLHAQGFVSIGCQPCTRAVRPGEPARAGRWWWEAEDGKECGLHRSLPGRHEARA